MESNSGECSSSSETKQTSNTQLDQTIENDSKNYTSIKVNSGNKHFSALMENLNNLRDENSYCDVDLISGVDGTKVPAHRLILIASSRYFKAMFASGMEECGKKEISLENITGEALKLLINYCYTGEMEINTQNIEKVLVAASQLEFVEIEKHCSLFLETYLIRNPLHCVSYYGMAKLYNFESVQQLSQHLMRKQFEYIKNTPEFQELDFDVLYEVIKMDDLNAQHEEDVFKCVIKWINHKKVEREKYLPDFMKIIRFNQMEIDFLIKDVMDFLIKNELKELYQEILRRKYDPGFKSQLLSEVYFNPRKITKKMNTDRFFLLSYPSILKTYHTNPSTRKILHKHFNLPNFDAIFAVIKWQTHLFCFIDSQKIIDIDMDSSVIEDLPNFSQPRKDCAVAVYKDNLYLVGGIELHNDTLSKQITRYNINSKFWDSFAFLPIDIVDPIVAITEDKLYCISRTGKPFSCIDLSTKFAQQLPLPNNIGIVRQMIAHEKDLFVASNYYVWKYDTLMQTWISITGCPFGATIISNRRSNRIFNLIETSPKTHFKVENYNVTQNDWSNCGTVTPEDPLIKIVKIFVFED